jgi:hypothetical protein
MTNDYDKGRIIAARYFEVLRKKFGADEAQKIFTEVAQTATVSKGANNG